MPFFSVAMLVVRDGRGTILLRPSRCDRQGGSQAAGAVVLHARAGRVFSCKGCLEDTLFFIHRIQVVVHLHHLPTISGGGEHGAGDSMLGEEVRILNYWWIGWFTPKL